MLRGDGNDVETEMRRTVLLGFVAVMPAFPALAGPCDAPRWEALAKLSSSTGGEMVQVNMQPLASLAVPAGFTKVVASPQGTIAFHGYVHPASLLLAYETVETAKRHERSTPYTLFHAIFNGLDDKGCKYLAEGFQLDQQDYLLRVQRSPNFSIYAYGKGPQHKFYVLDERQPEWVLVGSFKNATRVQLETVLSTIHPN